MTRRCPCTPARTSPGIRVTALPPWRNDGFFFWTACATCGISIPICFLPSSRIAPSVSSSIGEQILALRDGAGVPPKKATLKADSIAQINVKHVSPAPLGLDHLNLLDQFEKLPNSGELLLVSAEQLTIRTMTPAVLH